MKCELRYASSCIALSATVGYQHATRTCTYLRPEALARLWLPCCRMLDLITLKAPFTHGFCTPRRAAATAKKTTKLMTKPMTKARPLVSATAGAAAAAAAAGRRSSQLQESRAKRRESRGGPRPRRRRRGRLARARRWAAARWTCWGQPRAATGPRPCWRSEATRGRKRKTTSRCENASVDWLGKGGGGGGGNNLKTVFKRRACLWTEVRYLCVMQG